MTVSLRLRIVLVLVGAASAMAGVAQRLPAPVELVVESQPSGSTAVVEVAGATRTIVFVGTNADAEAYVARQSDQAGRPVWSVAMIAAGMVAIALGVIGRVPSRSIHDIDEGFAPGDLRDELQAHYGR